MPLLDQDPIDPEIAATLDAIDATLAGEPVDGRYAEVAEIALLLAADRPQVPPAFAMSLDAKVDRRFAPLGGKPRRFGAGGSQKGRRWSGVWQATGAIAAGVAHDRGDRGRRRRRLHGGSSVSSSSSASASVTSAAAASSGGGGPHGDLRPGRRRRRGLPSRSPRWCPPPTRRPDPPPRGRSRPGQPRPAGPLRRSNRRRTGRKVVQGAQLNLTAAPNRIDDVAQEIYDVVGQANGIVENSSVTQGGPGGAANFQLSLPSAGLAQTMSQLSSLNYAQVVSRTDSSQDITDQYGAATRSLADARALRTSLLKQLANATTTEQVNSLNAQIHDAEASISSDQATLNRLNHQVNFSQVYVTVQAKPVAAPVSHGGGGSRSAVPPTMPAAC